MGSVQPRPGVLPSPPLGKLAALAPQPQVLAVGNGNRVVLGPNICLLVLGEFSQPDKDMVFRYKGTVALIQDSGLNILVDSGSANSKNKLIAGKLRPVLGGSWKVTSALYSIGSARLEATEYPSGHLYTCTSRYGIRDHAPWGRG